MGAIISNTPSQSFWETSRLQDGNRGILTNFLGGKRGLAASDDTAMAALGDLEMLYPGISKKFEPRLQPIDGRIPGGNRQCMNWNKNPFTKGSYACVMLGQWTTIWGSCGEAELNNRLLFAGEHTSMLFQGFMEGGYESGMRAAEEVIASRSGGEVSDHYEWAKGVLGVQSQEQTEPLQKAN